MSQMERPPVCDNVVAHNLCIGCGTCAAVCPRERLDVVWNDRGCYEAKEKGEGCPEDCALCMDVCPFADGRPNEDELGYHLYSRVPNIGRSADVGYYRSCYVGYSLRGGQRENGASGGMATWFLTEMLRRAIADYVVCVQPQPGPRPLFKYVVCDSPEQVELGAKSAYYPVEMSEILRRILADEGRYAIICLPCFSKSLRLAVRSVRRLEERLTCVAGLVCGHGANAYFAEYAAALANPKAGPPSRITFRTKNPRLPAADHGTECSWDSEAGTSTKTIPWSKGLARAWSGYWFTPNPCLYCDDVFAETADIVFMDAWLPKYASDYRGTSLVVTRSEMSEDVVRKGIEAGEVRLTPCTLNDVARSQATALREKRQALAHRLWLARQRGSLVPEKRVLAWRDSRMLQRLLWNSQVKAVEVSASIWRESADPRTFAKRMQRISPLVPALWLSQQALRGLGRIVSK